MFEMIEEESSKDKTMAIVRVSALTVAVLALGAAIYFFAFVPYGKG